MFERAARNDRRSLLKHTVMGIGACGIWGAHPALGLAAPEEAASAGELPRPHFRPRAKRVIQFFLNGGPSHVDTFDPKPELKRFAGRSIEQNLTTERKTGAAFPSPFQFRRYGQSGIEVSELFEQTAQHIDDIAVIRSMYAQVPNHEPSLMLMNCGDSVQARPSVGAWLSYGLGSENPNLPGFIAMCPGGMPIKDAENWRAAFLPGEYQGTYVDSKHREVRKLIENIEHPHVTSEQQKRQMDLVERWNRRHLRRRDDDRLSARMHAFDLAYRMQQDAAEAFDLSRESASTRRMYGTGVHARQTLMARRLVERGVRYVQLWHGAGQPWDNHENIAENHRRLAGQIDQPIAALLTDLKQRGMLEDTLVIWGGEFGRTPTVELGGDGDPKLGRDHNHYGFSVWMAGGGIRGGTVYGGTDEVGFQAVENPTSVHDLHATILHTLGLDHTRLTHRYAGRDFRLTDVHGHVIDQILA